jgi:hypothetical protein
LQGTLLGVKASCEPVDPTEFSFEGRWRTRPPCRYPRSPRSP